MRVSFVGRVATNHTAFIRIKASQPAPTQELLILPVEVEVSTGIKHFTSLLSFEDTFQSIKYYKLTCSSDVHRDDNLKKSKSRRLGNFLFSDPAMVQNNRAPDSTTKMCQISKKNPL